MTKQKEKYHYLAVYTFFWRKPPRTELSDSKIIRHLIL